MKLTDTQWKPLEQLFEHPSDGGSRPARETLCGTLCETSGVNIHRKRVGLAMRLTDGVRERVDAAEGRRSGAPDPRGRRQPIRDVVASARSDSRVTARPPMGGAVAAAFARL